MPTRKAILDVADDLIRLIKSVADDQNGDPSALHNRSFIELRDEAIGKILSALDVDTAKDTEIADVEQWRSDNAARNNNVLTSTIETLSEGIALYDPEDRLVFCNSRMLGWNPSSAHLMLPGVQFESILRGNAYNGAIHGISADIEGYIATRLEQHRNPTGAIAQRRENGTWIEITEHRTPDGYTFILNIDITDRKQAEEALILSEERFRHFAGASSDWFWEIDEHFVFTYISEQFEQVTGKSPSDYLGKTRWDMSAPDNEIWAAHRAVLEAQLPYRDFEYELGADTYLSVSGVPFFDENGVFRGYRGAAKDVTSTRKTNEKLRQAQRIDTIGQLTGGVAHDFNNLLAVILGNLELLEDFDLPEPAYSLLDRAKTASLRGSDLTRNMLAFARKATLKPELLDINAVARDTKNWIGRTLPSSISIETSLLAGLWKVKADPSSLESAILNLILNARDAMDGRGKLTVETSNLRIDESYIRTRMEDLDTGRYVMLAISDTGHGIAEDELHNIFEPFHTSKEAGKGSGLGLSMVQGFMKQSGGTVRVYSEAGHGTTFKLFFPATDDAPEEDVLVSSHRTQGANDGLRILLAEDEAAVRETLVEIIERAGYCVTATATGDAAFAAFSADPTFDLLLTDIVMPGALLGTDLAKKIRTIWPDQPIAFMSGYANEATVHGNGLRPGDIRLMKPIQRSELLAAIANAVRLSP